MSLFRRTERSLHERHAAAHAVGQNALGVFHALAQDLDAAANEHFDVAGDAHAEAQALLDLKASAVEAADRSQRQADAIRRLVA